MNKNMHLFILQIFIKYLSYVRHWGDIRDTEEKGP